MMQTLRKYMKHIFWVVSIAFIATIVFSWGMGGFKDKTSGVEQGIIGIINGRKIQYQEYAQTVSQRLDLLKEEQGTTDIPEYRIQSIRDEVWESMVQNILYAQEIKRLGIQATPQEVVFQLRNNPPDFIRSIEQFQTDGQFDMTKYQQALSDPRNYDQWIPVENILRGSIPMQKLQQYVLSTIRITDEEVRDAYIKENQKVNAKYIFFDPTNVSLENIEVSDSEIKTYYEERSEEYRVPEKRKVEYVVFEGKPSAEDSSQIWEDSYDILQRLKAGVDFEELAKESDDEGTKDRGGDLGFFGKGDMVKPFEEAAFSANIRDFIGPVETQHGLHIIQVLARKFENGETKVHARHILLKFKTSPETYDDLNNKADYFYDEVNATKAKQFAKVAEQEGLTVQETPPFQEGSFIPGIGMVSRLNYLVFREKLNYVSPPTSTGENIIVFRISEIQKPQSRPLEEVESSIRNILQREKQKDKSGELCRQVWEKINGGLSFEQAADEDSVEIRETGPFGLLSYISGIGRDPHIAGAAFQLNVGEMSNPIDGERGYYLIQVIDRTEIDERLLETALANKRQELMRQKQQRVFMAWYNELKEKADIDDYRNQYF